MKKPHNITEQLQDMYILHLAERTVRGGGTKLIPRYRGYQKWDTQFKNGPLTLINEDDKVWASHPQPLDIVNQTKTIWIWSDHHFGHKNIIEFCDRPYGDVHHMNSSLINAHNNCVKENDIVIWVGDVSFMSDVKTNETLEKLTPTYKILIIGNHDMSKGKLKRLNFDEFHLLYCMELEDMVLVFTHFPFYEMPISTLDMGMTENKPLFNFHGHTHAEVMVRGRHINIAVEATEYKPVALGQIYKDVLYPESQKADEYKDSFYSQLFKNQ